jgi:hypothetical protein
LLARSARRHTAEQRCRGHASAAPSGERRSAATAAG